MNSQFARPSLVSVNGQSTPLDKITLSPAIGAQYDEHWLQNLVFSTPSLLPIEEIEPTFAGAVPVCREMMTAVGPLDIVFINNQGLLTFVECKLWRNPEARRKVIGQILDYAQDISRWDYEQLDAAVRKAGSPVSSLWKITQDAFALANSDEATFIDRVTRHLRNGTFLLLILGDGIRENTEAITGYLNQHAALGFALGLVETQIFRIPGKSELLVQPRVLAKTVELGRLVIRTEQSGIIIENDAKSPSSEKSVGRTLSETLFVEEVAGTSELATKLQQFFDRIKNAGLLIKATTRGASLKICTPMTEINLLTISRTGEVANHGIGQITGGSEYLTALSKLIPDTKVRVTNRSGWHSTIRRNDDGRVKIEDIVGQAVPIVELLKRTSEVIDAAQSELSPNLP